MYSTVIKLKRSLGDKAELILSGISDNVLCHIITDSSCIIDSYLKTITMTPFDESNAILNNICISLSKVEIYRRFARNDIPKDISDQESKAYETLEKIQKKNILIETPETHINDLQYTCESRVFDTKLG